MPDTDPLGGKWSVSQFADSEAFPDQRVLRRDDSEGKHRATIASS